MPVWCEMMPLRTVLGEAEECPRHVPGATAEANGLGSYVGGWRFDKELREAGARSDSDPIEVQG